MCDICGEEIKKLLWIESKSEMSDMIEKYLPLRTFPVNVCSKCKKKIENWHLFYQKCLQVDKGLISNNQLADEDLIGFEEQDSEQRTNDEFLTTTKRNRNLIQDELHKCPHCNLSIYGNLNKFNKHLKFFHDDSILSCEVCKQRFPKEKLINHMTTHTLKLGQNQDKAIESLKLKSKIKTSSSREKKFSCEYCEPGKSTFSTKRLLTNHIQNCHTKEKNFICEICQKGFKTDSSLYIHKKAHSNNKPFQCFCSESKTYKFNHHLKAHIQRQHLKEKLFNCNFCKKKFYCKNNLTKHVKIHEINENGFKCHICDLILRQNRYLKAHLRKIHMKQ